MLVYKYVLICGLFSNYLGKMMCMVSLLWTWLVQVLCFYGNFSVYIWNQDYPSIFKITQKRTVCVIRDEPMAFTINISNRSCLVLWIKSKLVIYIHKHNIHVITVLHLIWYYKFCVAMNWASALITEPQSFFPEFCSIFHSEKLFDFYCWLQLTF